MEQLLIHSYEEFPEVLRLQAVSFMRIEWPFIYAGENRLWMETFPSELNPVHFTVSEDNVLISHAEVVQAELNHQGKQFAVRGLGNVFTFPPFRRCGYGKTVVKAATDYILKGNVDAAFLKTNAQLEHFYSPFGWETINDFSGTDQLDRPITMGILMSDWAKDNASVFFSHGINVSW